MKFEGKVALVTGAVRNTGLAIAEAFAAEGATVVLNGRKPEDVAREAVRLRQTYGAAIVEAAADIARQEEVDAMFANIKSECGRLDVLVNNAIVQGCGSIVNIGSTTGARAIRMRTAYCASKAAIVMAWGNVTFLSVKKLSMPNYLLDS